jgi:hypothetical protein
MLRSDEGAMNEKMFTPTAIMRYTFMVISAIECGVPYSEIMHETESYHGKRFASMVRNHVESIIG